VANRRAWPVRHGNCTDLVLVPAVARTDHGLPVSSWKEPFRM